MKSTLHNVSEIVARANDMFYKKFDNIDTLMGIMDKTLRNQGMKADAITIDCIALDKKIVILIHDEKPNSVDIALGNKKGDIYSSLEYEITALPAAVLTAVFKNRGYFC